jgi:cyclophilin family peptidyl-prolyl cis-trans isomerase
MEMLEAHALRRGLRSFRASETKAKQSQHGSTSHTGVFMENTYVLISTSLGDILIELYKDKAPVSVDNFLRYVDEGHYNDTIFHRVVRNFVVQGGGYDYKLNKKPTHEPIANEAKNGLSNVKGTLAMARSAEKDSARDEFFINAEDNGETLDHCGESDEDYGYAVFGMVEEGMEIVKKINWGVVKPQEGFEDLPADPVDIIRIERLD